MSGGVGRADLARLLLAFPEAGAAELAEYATALGFRMGPARAAGRGRAGAGEVLDAEGAAPAGSAAAAAAAVAVQLGSEPGVVKAKPPYPVPIWLPVSVRYRDDEPPPQGDAVKGLTHAELNPQQIRARLPAAPPLCRWSRLWPALHRAIAVPAPTSQVDERALVESMSRGRVPGRLPRRVRPRWPARLHVKIDTSPRLMRFRGDGDDVFERLCRLIGDDCVRAEPERADAVLVIGDLGFMGSAAERARWSRLAERYARAGVRAAALVIAPPDRWEPALAARFGAIAWESPGARRPAARPAGDDDKEERRRWRAERLLCLLSPAVQIQPGLMREVRKLLPAGEADAGTEHDVWNHPDVASDHWESSDVDPEAAAAWRAAFVVGDEPDHLRRAAVALIRRWHAHMPPELWQQEALALVAAGGGHLLPGDDDREDAVRFARQLALTMEPGRVSADVQGELAGWCRDMTARLPDGAFLHPVVGEDLGSVCWSSRDPSSDEPLPPGVLPPRAAAGRRARTWEIVQARGEIRIFPLEDRDPPGGAAGRGGAGAESEVALVDAVDPRLAVAGVPVLDLDNGGPRFERAPGEAPGRGREMVLRTDRVEIHVAALTRPWWARAFGRDRYGAFADMEEAGVRARLRYIPPGRFLMGSPEGEVGRDDDEGPQHEVTITHGFWLGDTPCTQELWEAVTGKNPSHYKDDSPDGLQRPVESVSFDECRSFADQIGARLPTEAEWEYACRAGTVTATFEGDLRDAGTDTVLDEIAVSGQKSGGPRPVKGSRRCNRWGLFDMLGNVYEWCEDAGGKYDEGAVADPIRHAPEGRERDVGAVRVLRGGSWGSHAGCARAAYRSWHHPGSRGDDFGFRLARGQEEAPEKEKNRRERSERGRSEAAAEPPGERSPEPPTKKKKGLFGIFRREKKT